jgi:alpha-mannosidase
MGLSLLRSTKLPDRQADMTTHRFRYGLMVHGSFDAGGVVAAAEALNLPVRAVLIDAAMNAAMDVGIDNASSNGQPTALPTLEGPHAAGVVIDTVKPAEEVGGTILRLYECQGGRGRVDLRLPGAAAVEEVDLLERPVSALKAQGGLVPLEFRPFQIRTLRVRSV